MDMYRILENFDAVNSKQTLVEGQMKRQLEARAEQMSKAAFVANAGEYGMSDDEAAEFWIAVNGGDDEELDEAYDKLPVDQLGLDKFSQAALSGGQRKRDALANPERARMLAKKAAQQQPVREVITTTVKKGDRVSVEGKPAVVVGQMKTPAGAAKYFAVRFDGRQYPDNTYDQVHANRLFPMSQVDEDEMEEGNEFSGELAKAKASGAKEFEVDGKSYPVKEGAKSKPDFLDMDRDGDKKEPMKKAVKDKNDAKGSFQKQMGGSAKELTKGLSIGAKKVSEQLDEVFPGTPEYELRFGKDDASSAFDKKKISTGTVYSRRYQDEPESDDDTPRAAGRPKGAKRRLGAKGPSVSSKFLTGKNKGGLKEQDIDIEDRGEYDREGDMALNQVHQIADAARELHAILASDDNLPEWVQSKITKALDYIDTARDYLDAEGEMDREEMPEVAPVAIALGRAAVAGAASGAVQSAMDEEEMEESALQGYLGKKKYGADGMKALQQAGRDGASKEKMAKIRAQHDQMDEADMAEADYSAKAARAGKDIGKPGKNFGKIARDAAERYGSKAAGERVAGAVLNKLRTKEGVAEESADKRDPPFSADKQSPFKKTKNPNRSASDTVKALAQKGLADMTTAELKSELQRRDKVEEESNDTRDQHAEKSGKKVTRDLEYDMKHKGKDDAKAEKAGKKVTRDIEYDDKKDKKKEVEETTVSGSVATGGNAPAKSKGGMQFGKGVYEGQVAESFEKKLGSILNEGMSVNVSTDDTGKKSITVSATDADADALGDMLKMAGLFSSESHSQSCGGCGMMHEAGACPQQMEEDLANTPNEMYADADYMTQTLSGGLNGPKTTGQTTGAVVNRQDSRQGVMAEADQVVEQAESRLWNLYRKI